MQNRNLVHSNYKFTKNIANFLIIRQLFSDYFRRTHVNISINNLGLPKPLPRRGC